jgi:hypothetical protein
VLVVLNASFDPLRKTKLYRKSLVIAKKSWVLSAILSFFIALPSAAPCFMLTLPSTLDGSLTKLAGTLVTTKILRRLGDVKNICVVKRLMIFDGGPFDFGILLE